MSAIRNGIDPLHPFVNSNTNRSEIFYIEFDGFLCNRSMNVIANMFLTTNSEIVNWYTRYPFINNFADMTSNNIFHIVKMYNPYELLFEMDSSNENSKLTNDEICEDIRTLEKNGVIKYQQLISFAYALRKMLQENCIKKIYIQKEYEFYDWEKNFIKDLLDPYLNKIELLEGPSFYAYKEVADEVTTAFINFPQMLDQIHSEIPKEKIEKALFLIRGNKNTLKYNKENDLIEYIDPNLTQRNAERNIKCGIIFTESVNEDPLDERIIEG